LSMSSLYVTEFMATYLDCCLTVASSYKNTTATGGGVSWTG
jgi:hypothetical protein